MNKLVSICILFIANESSLLAQVAVEWENTIGGSYIDRLSVIHPTLDGGYIAGGTSRSPSSGDKIENNYGYSDYWVVKLNASGIIEWENTIGGAAIDELYAIAISSDGGYLLGGRSESGIGIDKTDPSIGYWDYWIVKLDSAGNIVWQKTIGGDNGDDLISVQKTSDNGYILGGLSVSGISGDKTEPEVGGGDYWVVKIDSVGNIQWQNTIGSSTGDFFTFIQQTMDGGYIMSGDTYSPASGDKTENSMGGFDYWVVKLDSLGTIEWENTIGGNYSDEFPTICQTIDGSYILCGYSVSDSSGDKTENSEPSGDIWIVKLDISGNVEWDNTIGGDDGEGVGGGNFGKSIQQTIDGGFIVGSTSLSDISGDKTVPLIGGSDFWLLKLDVAGNIEWQSDIGGNDGDDCIWIEESPDYGFIIGATSYSNISGDKTENSMGGEDYWIVKLCNLSQVFFADSDSDGFGNASNTILACALPVGYVINDSDCDDADPNSHPGATEIINGIDDDCDGSIDETCSSGFYLVADTVIMHHYWAVNITTGVSPISYYWSWGDGSYDSVALPSHTYDTAGLYTICLFIEDSTGCIDSICVDYQLMKLEAINTIITVNVVDSIPTIPTTVVNTHVLQSWSVFPNPASGDVLVNYALSVPATVNLEVFDVLGNNLWQIANVHKESGAYNSSIDVEKLPNGVYILQIHAGDQIASQKIVVMN